jgi:hypothetical protein
MGKAAYNEGVKLWATWLNNVSVGLFITGVFVPYLAFVQNVSAYSPPTFHDLLPAFHDFLGGKNRIARTHILQVLGRRLGEVIFAWLVSWFWLRRSWWLWGL